MFSKYLMIFKRFGCNGKRSYSAVEVIVEKIKMEGARFSPSIFIYVIFIICSIEIRYILFVDFILT